jgi:plasmid stabilization system protein ParE
MPSAKGVRAKLAVRWTSDARAAVDRSLEHIATQDRNASELVNQWLLAALDAISLQPGIGTSTRRKNTRRFPIPKTGHAIEYRVVEDEITVTRWVRQSRVRKL